MTYFGEIVMATIDMLLEFNIRAGSLISEGFPYIPKSFENKFLTVRRKMKNDGIPTVFVHPILAPGNRTKWYKWIVNPIKAEGTTLYCFKGVEIKNTKSLGDMKVYVGFGSHIRGQPLK